jgi:GNAT superfamily N-acetyltransferase
LTADVSIRAATPEDVPVIRTLIAELAEYERAPDAAVGTDELITRALFGTPPHAEAVIASLDGAIAGFALFFGTFSTWLSRPGIWLEDLFVRPQFRGSGVGRALFAHVASIAVARECPRLEWTVLKWNTPAVGFYERLGAVPMEEWQTMRLSDEALGAIASGA